MAQLDSFPGTDKAVNSPYTRWASITPNADNDLAERPRAVHNAGSAGTITCSDGTNTIAIYFAQGATLAIRPKRITAAAGGVTVVALY